MAGPLGYSAISGLGFPDDWVERQGTPEFSPTASTLPPEATSGGTVAMPLPEPSGGGMPLDIGGSSGTSGLPLGSAGAATPPSGRPTDINALLASILGPSPATAPDTNDKGSLIAATIADALTALGGGKSNFVGAMREDARLRLAEQTERRRAEIEGKKLVLDTVKAWDQLQGTQFSRAKETIGTIAEFLKQSPGASSPQRMAAVKQLGQVMGGLVPADVLEAMASDPDLAALAGDLLPFVSSAQEAGVAMGTVGGMLRGGKTPQEARDALEKMAAPGVASDTFAHVRNFAKSGAARTFDDLLRVVEAVPGKGRAMAALLRGDRFAKEQRGPILDVLARLGIKGPGIAAAKEEAGEKSEATRAGTLAAEGSPEGLAATQAGAQATRAGQITAETTPGAITGQAAKAGAVEREQKAAGEPFTIRAEARAEAVAERKARSDRMLAATGPATPEQIASLRDDYRQDSKSFQIAKDAWANVQSAGTRKTPTVPSDISLIVSWYHISEPTSIVREGEFDRTTANRLPQWMQTFWVKLQHNTILTPKERKAIVDDGKALFAERLASQVEIEDRYHGIAERRKIDRSEFPDYIGRFRPPSYVRPAGGGRPVRQ